MSYKPVIYSGRCLCGHLVEDHHCCCVLNPEAYKVIGPVVPDECCYYGCNEDGGLDEKGNPHCFRYVDKADPDPETVSKWKGTKRGSLFERAIAWLLNAYFRFKWRVY